MASVPDIVYLVGPQPMNEELRYSLRSLRNLPHGRVFIAGYAPTWAKPDEMIGVQRQRTGGPFVHTTDSLRAAALHPDLSEEFVVMNDDFFITAPIDDLPVWHRGCMPPPTARLFHGTIGPQPLSYELHIPMAMTKTRVLKMLELPILPLPKTMLKRSLYGNHYGIGGEMRADVKVKWARQPWTDTGFLSTNDFCFANAAVGVYIRRMFSKPSPYEEVTPS